jgi:hypothetical protein
LNATDDREHFVKGHATSRHLPIVEGKQIQPFVVHLAAPRHHIHARVAARILGADGPFVRPRLAYRDVASPTNRLTLIAAMIPDGVVTTHTLFCLKGDVNQEIQWFLCGVFNSFVANYLVRTRVGTHVTVSIIDQLPVPRLSVESAAFRRIGALSAALTADPSDAASAAQLQACVAQVYRLTGLEFQHVLDTFPLISTAARAAAMQQFMSPPEGNGEPHRS